MARSSSRLLALTGLAIALAVLAACGSDGTPSADGSVPPSPQKTTFEEPEWTIQVPAGWTREDVTANADAKKAIRYKDADGDYVIVHIDPLGSDFGYDVLWRYEVKDTGFEIVSKEECKGTEAEQCSDDDSRYDGYVLWKVQSGDAPKVGGHTYYFAFGNSAKTTVDLVQFEEILESIRAKSA